jgi:hypothetical protein
MFHEKQGMMPTSADRKTTSGIAFANVDEDEATSYHHQYFLSGALPKKQYQEIFSIPSKEQESCHPPTFPRRKRGSRGKGEELNSE